MQRDAHHLYFLVKQGAVDAGTNAGQLLRVPTILRVNRGLIDGKIQEGSPH